MNLGLRLLEGEGRLRQWSESKALWRWLMRGAIRSWLLRTLGAYALMVAVASVFLAFIPPSQPEDAAVMRFVLPLLVLLILPLIRRVKPGLVVTANPILPTDFSLPPSPVATDEHVSDLVSD